MAKKPYSAKGVILRDLIILRDRLGSYQSSRMEAMFLSTIIKMIVRDL